MPAFKVASSRWFLICKLAPAVMLSACTTLDQDIVMKDRGAPGGAVRATFRGLKGDPPARLGAGLEIGIEGYKAEGSQHLAAGNTLVLDGTTFTGPQDMRYAMNWSQVHAAYNHRFRIIGRFVEIEPYVGVVGVQAKVQATSAAGVRVNPVDVSRLGLTGGVTPRLRVNDHVALELRYNAMHTGFRLRGVSYEGVVVLRPVDTVALRLGWIGRRHVIEKFMEEGLFPRETAFHVHSSGPFASLQFDF